MEKDLLNTVNEVEVGEKGIYNCPMCGADIRNHIYNTEYDWDGDEGKMFEDFICKECGAKGYVMYKIEYMDTLLLDD